jgi:2'-5' RNA ligase
MHKAAETWRVFCAIELPEPVRKLVLLHVAQLKEKLPEVRASWARDTNLHLTLKFLGEIPTSSVAEVSKAATLAVDGQRPFSIRLEHTGAFPSSGQPRVLWIGVNDVSAKLAELHARLENECALNGFAKETRPFSPHLTVARLRQSDDARALVRTHKQTEFDPVEIAVTELLVIRSELGKDGSKYTVISRHPFDLAG